MGQMACQASVDYRLVGKFRFCGDAHDFGVTPCTKIVPSLEQIELVRRRMRIMAGSAFPIHYHLMGANRIVRHHAVMAPVTDVPRSCGQ